MRGKRSGNGHADDGHGESGLELRLEIRILGPLEVWSDGVPIDVGRGRQRALLAILALHPAKAVSSDELIDELWDGRPPPTASKALQNLVSQLVAGDALRVER